MRLNSHPVPAAFLPAGIERAGRRAAVQEWLELACGDYALARVRFVAAYLAFAEDDLLRFGAELDLFKGLYTAEDWLWSALRPLPRAWIDLPDGPVMMDFAFWDGTQLFAVQLAPPVLTLRDAGIVVIQPPDYPSSFGTPWRSDRLPSSPFRRPIGAL